MNMGLDLPQVIYIFSNIPNVYIIFQFIKLIYKGKDFLFEEKYKLFFLMLVYYLITTTLHIMFANPFINAFVGIVLIFGVSFFYITPMNEKVSKTIFLYFLLTMEDYIVFKLCSLLNLQNTQYWASLVNIVILTLILFLLKRSKKILKKQDAIYKNDFKVIFIMAMSIFLII